MSNITMGTGLPKYLFTDDLAAPRLVRANYGLGGWVAKNQEYSMLFQQGKKVPPSWTYVRAYMLQTQDMRQFACMLELQAFCYQLRRKTLLFANWEHAELERAEGRHAYNDAIYALALAMASVGNGGLYAAYCMTTAEGAAELAQWDDL